MIMMIFIQDNPVSVINNDGVILYKYNEHNAMSLARA